MQFVTRKRDIVNFLSPQEMYDDYKNRSINGIQDYQSKMLDLYMKEGLDKSLRKESKVMQTKKQY